MHFIVNREQVLNPLSRVNTVVDRNPTIPILSHVLLEPVEEGIKLTGSNIEIEISEIISDIEVHDPQPVAFPGLTVQDFCRRLPERCGLKFEVVDGKMYIDKIESKSDGSDSQIEQNNDDYSNNVRYSTQSKLVLQTLSQEPADSDFPKLDAGEWDIQFTIGRSDLHNLILRTQHAMGADNVRYYLNAMLFEIGENELRTISTDGHRMAMSETAVVTGLNETTHRAIVPRKTVLDLSKLLSELSSQIEIELNASHIRVSNKYVSFTSKLLEGQYPDWRGAIPVNLSSVFRGDREELVSIFQRVNILGARDKKPLGATLEVDGGVLRVYARSTSSALQEIDETMDVEQDGESLKFQANCRYLLDIFEAMPDCSRVEFNLRNAQTACLIKFPHNKSSSFLVMLLKDR